jgi:peptidoglycan/xylan/chitin deacetylase (PgdA/CDA1 family)
VLSCPMRGEPPSGGWDTWYFIPQTTFAEQLDVICSSGWSVIDLPAFLRGLDDPETVSDRSVLLTFDDGHKSFRLHAFPVLRQLGLSAVCFIPTDHIGGSSTFDLGIEPEEPLCDWDDLREMSREGVTIQSHGASHGWASLMEPLQWREEIARSKRTIEIRLGEKVETLAFPFSDPGRDAEAVDGGLREAGYRAAFLCGGGPEIVELPVRDRFRIDRLAMYRDTDLKSLLSVGTTV